MIIFVDSIVEYMNDDDKIGSKAVAHLESLDAFEHHEHLHLADAAVEVGVALQHSVPH